MTVECGNCGEAVSEAFARVFGDNADELDGCPECTVFREYSDGGAGANGGSA